MTTLANLFHLGPFGKKNDSSDFKVSKLTSKIETALESRFGLTTWDMERLRYSKQVAQGPKGSTIRRLVIFDPTLIGAEQPLTFQDLCSRDAAILFIGTIDGQGNILLKSASTRRWPGPPEC